MLALEKPALAHKQALLDAFREFYLAGEYEISAEAFAPKFAALIERLDHSLDPAYLTPEELPYEDFWLMEDGVWIGKLTLRTAIDATKIYAAEHISLEIRPSYRGRGYGTTMLRLGLEKAAERGLARVLLICDETNIASRKVIERSGGKLEAYVDVEGQTARWMRYWIDL